MVASFKVSFWMGKRMDRAHLSGLLMKSGKANLKMVNHLMVKAPMSIQIVQGLLVYLGMVNMKVQEQ